MTRYTVQFGTCESSDGTVEKLYATQPDLYLDEFNKQKASFKNPDVTDESIRRIAEKVVNSRIACKLGEYEDIDTDPRQLAKAKQALEIIKKNLIVSVDESGKDLPCLVIGTKTTENNILIFYSTHDKEKINLLKEVLL